MKSHEIRSQVLEIIGLFLLLIAFGVQCIQLNREGARNRSLAYEINQHLFAIHTLVYNDALKQDYYKGESLFKIDEAAYSPYNYDWDKIVKTNERLNKEASISCLISALLYMIGSILVIRGRCVKLNEIDFKRE